MENRVTVPIKPTQYHRGNKDVVEKQNNDVMATDKEIFSLGQGNFT